ncbi:MAG: hypothetical protein Q8940_02945 [Bacteroidota bacterium]|nr:hypothetical protein [Bacteroidota bacterium]
MKLFCVSMILLISLTICNAQEVQIGLRTESIAVSTNPKTTQLNDFVISSLQVNGTVFLSDKVGIDLRAGSTGNDYYKGLELGLFSRYYYNDYYAIGGLIYHHNEKGKVDINSTDLFLPAIGVGYHPGRHFAIEFMVEHGLNKVVDHEFVATEMVDIHTTRGYWKEINLTWITKLGISYSFSL